SVNPDASTKRTAAESSTTNARKVAPAGVALRSIVGKRRFGFRCSLLPQMFHELSHRRVGPGPIWRCLADELSQCIDRAEHQACSVAIQRAPFLPQPGEYAFKCVRERADRGQPQPSGTTPDRLWL